MKRQTTKFIRTSIKRICDNEGLSIEETIRRAIASNQPLEGNSPNIFTEASEGVLAQYDIRTDKQDLALAANDKYQASDQMKGFLTQVEYDENGFDGKKFKEEQQPKNEK